MPGKFDCTDTRAEMYRLRDEIKIVRLRYIDLMRKRFIAMPKSRRMRFLAELPDRMHALGLYAESTYWQDILRHLIQRWYKTDPDHGNCDIYHRYQHWHDWQRKNGVDFAKAHKEYKIIQQRKAITCP